ncbi:MAG TPA: SRPBCC domain-containing protein [Actinomycetota bacterium]|nr:SRPBCC domain-containing protein [Actinomycetota bacterium]
MSTIAEELVTTQVYKVYIKATPQAIWDAITKPEWTARFGYGGEAQFDERPGGSYRHLASVEMKQAGKAGGFEVPDVVVDGEVIECDPPHRLVHTFRMLMDARTAGEGFTQLTYDIAEGRNGVSILTVTHDLERAPTLAALVAGKFGGTAGGGWPWVLSGLKTLLETGESMGNPYL